MAHPDPEVRANMDKFIDRALNATFDISVLLKAFWLYRETSDEYSTLTREDRLFINSTIDAYEDIFLPEELYL